MRLVKFALAFLAASAFCNSQARPQNAPTGTGDRKISVEGPDELQKLVNYKKGDLAVLSDNARLSALRQEAYEQGVKIGLHHRYSIIESQLSAPSVDSSLDVVFNFEALLIDGQMLPPVFTIAGSASRLYNEQLSRDNQISYRMEHPARLVSNVPSWESFLVKGFTLPEPPSDVILPKNDEERNIWAESVKKGWGDGVERADEIFNHSLSLLTRTYTGMLNFKILLADGIVSAPIATRTNLGITTDGKELRIGDTITRIAEASEFKPASEWTPTPRDDTPVVLPQ